MDTNVSIEDRKIFAALAVAAADVLEHPLTPASLVDALTEVTSELTNLLLLSASHSATLRALASIVDSGDAGARTEAESFAIASPGAKSGA